MQYSSAARLPWTRTQHWLLSALVLVALSHGVIATVAGPGLIAWLPDHSHLVRGGVAPPHLHPWDASWQAATRASAATGATASTAPEGIVFTPGNDATGSVAAAAVPAAATLLVLAALVVLRLHRVARAPLTAPLEVAVPPPRD